MLGTNYLVELGFKITNSDGSVVESGTNDNKGETSSPKESSDQFITDKSGESSNSNQDCGESDKLITNQLEGHVSTDQNCGKSDGSITNHLEGSVTSDYDK